MKKIAEAHERMDDLVADALALARQGQTVLSREPVSLDRVCRSAWENVDTRSATLEVTTDRTVSADDSQLTQLFENLFRNAVEHGSASHRSRAHEDAVEHGGSEVAVTVGEFEDGFFIADDGPGIPADEREDVFEKGYSTESDGTGFGLAIVETIADAHGWSVGVTDSDDGGARFEFRVDTGTDDPDTDVESVPGPT
jgi:signal transduction histidine kinase